MVHKEPIEKEFIRFKVNKFIRKDTLSVESKIKSNRFIPIFSITSTKQLNQFYPDIFDWLLGRLSGVTIRMVVREAKIVEKVFLTPKGNRIFVKRSELEIWIRSMPIIRINLSLRFRSNKTMLFRLRPLTTQLIFRRALER